MTLSRKTAEARMVDPAFLTVVSAAVVHVEPSMMSCHIITIGIVNIHVTQGVNKIFLTYATHMYTS